MRNEKLVFKTSNGISEIISDYEKINALIYFLPLEAGIILNDLIKQH